MTESSRYLRRSQGSEMQPRGKSPHASSSRGPPICPKFIFDPKYQTTYDIHQCLGKGGFAYVYKATSDSETFAIKVISLVKIQSPNYADKIQREIDIHKRLTHANIVSLYSTFQDEYNVYLLLDYCPYGTLLDYINSRPNNRLSESHAIVFLKQILKATRYLHAECKILHRDIKPGNVLLSSNMTARLADFGFSCYISEEKRSQHHSLCGTPNYLAPEVIARRGHSTATEAWAIGCTFYCMVYGKPPFESDHLQKTYEMIKRCAYYLPENVTVSQRSRDLILRVLIDNPAKRLTIPDMLRHDVFSTLNRSNSHGSALNGQLADLSISRSCQNLVSPTVLSSRSPRSLSRVSSRNVNVDSGLGNDPSSSFSRGLGRILEKYIRLVDSLTEESNRVSVEICDDGSLPDLYVSKWVDYTNRFGFGCTLKNGVRTALFLDDTAMSVTPDEKLYAYWPRKTQDESFQMFSPRTSHQWQLDVIEKMTKMKEYMDNHLHATVPVDEDRHDLTPAAIHIVAYKKFSNGICMLLSDGTTQVNFSSFAKLIFRTHSDALLVTLSHMGQHTTFLIRESLESSNLNYTSSKLTDYSSALTAATDVFRDLCRDGSTGCLAGGGGTILSTAC
uniref:Serine/threonine-protein kinase PLK n=1 Tax=Panagrellus redivivus TaxID=6233 RepID=A0A7E4UME4_PANRE